MLWGLQFRFEVGEVLVAAALHGEFLSDPIVNDELVVAFTPEAIRTMIALRDGYTEEWRAS